MARACIAVNSKIFTIYQGEFTSLLGKDDAISALKQSVALDNPSDWCVLSCSTLVDRLTFRLGSCLSNLQPIAIRFNYSNILTVISLILLCAMISVSWSGSLSPRPGLWRKSQIAENISIRINGTLLLDYKSVSTRIERTKGLVNIGTGSCAREEISHRVKLTEARCLMA